MFIQVETDLAQTDNLLSLQGYLHAEPELRGRVATCASAPAPGALGAPIDALTITLGSGGATSAIYLMTTWMKQRTTDLTLKISGQSGVVVEVQTARVKRMTLQELSTFVDDLQRTLE